MGEMKLGSSEEDRVDDKCFFCIDTHESLSFLFEGSFQLVSKFPISAAKICEYFMNLMNVLT